MKAARLTLTRGGQLKFLMNDSRLGILKKESVVPTTN